MIHAFVKHGHTIVRVLSLVFGEQASGGSLRWQENKVGLPILSNGDPYRPLLVEFFSYKK